MTIFSNSLFVNLTLLLLLNCCAQVLTQNCGIWNPTTSNFLDPTKTIISNEFLDNFAINLRSPIWEAPTVNVTAAAAITHPHVEYIGGFRYSARYVYVPTDKTINFLDNQKPPVVREVEFNCSDGGSVTYHFEFPIKTSDVKKPIFHQDEYKFNITQNWPLERPINFHLFILAWDDDDDFINSLLKFEITNPNSPVLDVSVQHTPLWDENDPDAKPPAAYRLDLFLKNSSPPLGDYSLTLTGHSRRLSSSVEVSISVN